MPELEARQIEPCIETFAIAQQWLRKMRNHQGYTCDFDIDFIPPSFYVVTEHGQVIGRGEDYKSAITSAQHIIARKAHSKYIIMCGRQ